MTPRQKKAIAGFQSAVLELRESGVIRTDRYLGDIAEFLCADTLGVGLADNAREVGLDGHLQNVRVQIKYAGGTKTNVDLGNPAAYDVLYVVLGAGSVVRTWHEAVDFCAYRITSAEARQFLQPSGVYSCGKSVFARKPDFTISLEDVDDTESTESGSAP